MPAEASGECGCRAGYLSGSRSLHGATRNLLNVCVSFGRGTSLERTPRASQRNRDGDLAMCSRRARVGSGRGLEGVRAGSTGAGCCCCSAAAAAHSWHQQQDLATGRPRTGQLHVPDCPAAHHLALPEKLPLRARAQASEHARDGRLRQVLLWLVRELAGWLACWLALCPLPALHERV